MKLLFRDWNTLVFSLEEEEDLTIIDVSGRVRAAFDVEKSYENSSMINLKKEHSIRS